MDEISFVVGDLPPAKSEARSMLGGPPAPPAGLGPADRCTRVHRWDRRPELLRGCPGGTECGADLAGPTALGCD